MRYSKLEPGDQASELFDSFEDADVHDARLEPRSDESFNETDTPAADTPAPALRAEGSSSERLAHPDLESQAANHRLTTRQRIMNVVTRLVPIRDTYERLNNGLTTGRMQSNVPGRFIGQGTDGVFRNLMAKPDANSKVVDETNPPTYEEAAADATPEYWETSVISPIYEDEVFVEGLPVGNVANFIWNVLVTVAFQFIGFLLCYLLHTSHAAKHGARAGLGFTFMFYGYNLVPSNFGRSDKIPPKYQVADPNNINVDLSTSFEGSPTDTYSSGAFRQNALDDTNKAPYFAYGIIAFGLLMICKAGYDYFKVKQMESQILHPPNAAPAVTTTVTEDYNFNQSDGEEPEPSNESNSERRESTGQ